MLTNHVKNRRCIRELGFKTLKASKTRNIIAVVAIILTTLLFTSIFTIAISINEGFQQSTFRQVGGDFHGTFKEVTEARMNELRKDSLIKESGARLMLGMASGEPFNKAHVEVSYMEPVCAEHYFCEPEYGKLPEEGTDQAATDTRVLELLGVKPEVGAKFTITFDIDGNTSKPIPVTRSFTLSGWWEYDSASFASQVVLPLDKTREIAAMSSGQEQTMTGKWALNVMFGSSLNIEDNMEKVLSNHGYQNEGLSEGENFIATGVNWGYTGASINMDAGTAIALASVLLLIVFTGYLIIYNVFQISVTNDIRFYGLLKTIGSTGKQLKRIIRQQALMLSLMGIPLGLVLGWLVGVRLTPEIVSQLSGVSNVTSVNPVIFIGSAAFALFTVLISCRRPGKKAAKVSPVEAVRYSDTVSQKRKRRKTSKQVSLFSMAWANLGRSRGKTVVTVLSLSLAVMLLVVTVTFANGFDMQKYLSNFVAADFIVGDANYFQVGGMTWNAENAVPETLIDGVNAQGGIKSGGRTYGKTFSALELIDEDYYRQKWSRWNSQEMLDSKVRLMDREPDGKVADEVQLYGMERFCLDKLNVLEGDISGLYEPGSRKIAAVYSSDEKGNVYEDSHWARLGDKVKLRYVSKYEYYDPDTKEVYPEGMDLSNADWVRRAKEYKDIEYEVAALVDVPMPLGYRFYSADEFVMNDQTFISDSGTENVMYYACDMEDDAANAKMESYLKEYTSGDGSEFDYESRASYENEFHEFRRLFLLLGSALSFIVGLVGVLNFINAVLTGIIARKRELAVLQAVGMTGEQLKKMLVFEGLLYTMCAMALCLVLEIVLSPLMKSAMEGLFWFFTYRFTLTPVLIVLPFFVVAGALVPVLVYRNMVKRTVVQRLRETE